jgi:hypothetical protein
MSRLVATGKAAQRTEDHDIELGRDGAPAVASGTSGTRSRGRWPRRGRGTRRRRRQQLVRRRLLRRVALLEELGGSGERSHSELRRGAVWKGLVRAEVVVEQDGEESLVARCAAVMGEKRRRREDKREVECGTWPRLGPRTHARRLQAAAPAALQQTVLEAVAAEKKTEGH